MAASLDDDQDAESESPEIVCQDILLPDVVRQAQLIDDGFM